MVFVQELFPLTGNYISPPGMVKLFILRYIGFTTHITQKYNPLQGGVGYVSLVPIVMVQALIVYI